MPEKSVFLSKFDAEFLSFAEKRRDRVIASLYGLEQYKHYSDEHTRLFNRLVQRVGFQLADSFNNVCTKLQGLEANSAYLQGFEDAMRLRELCEKGLKSLLLEAGKVYDHD